MKKNFLLLVCFIFLFQSLHIVAQTENTQFANQVFDKLIKTINQSIPAKPKLIIVEDENFIAKTYPGGEIKIGIALINHCRSFGADSSNALAHILSHELTHYYNNHFWANEFGTSYADASWGEHIAEAGNTLSMVEQYETQADEYGMFYALSAGFNTIPISSRVLDSVYVWFHLNSDLKGYPSLNTRKEIAHLAQKKISSLLPVFETGNLFVYLAQIYKNTELLENAASCYDHLLSNHIQTKEMLNNAAVAELLSALQYADEAKSAFSYPFMLETKSILYDAQSQRGLSTEDSAALLEEKLERAETFLKQAIKQDKNFYPAFINLCILHLLAGNYGSANDAVSAAEKAANFHQQTLWQISELHGLIAAMQGDDGAMHAAFKNADKAGSPLSKRNNMIAEQVLLHHKIDESMINQFMGDSMQTNSFFVDELDTNELILGKTFYQFLNTIKINRANRFDLQNDAAVIFTDTISGMYAYELKPRLPNVRFTKNIFLLAKENDTLQTSKGLHIGSSMKELQKLYGKELLVLSESDADIYVFEKQHLMVWMSNGKVKQWAYWWLK